MKRLFILLTTLYVISLLPAYAQKPGIDAAETLIRAARAGRRVPVTRSKAAPAVGVHTLPVPTPSFQVPASYYRSTVSENPRGQQTKLSTKSQNPLSLHGPRTPLDTQPIHDYLKKVVSASQSTPEKPVSQTPQQPPQQTVTVQGPADDPIAYFRQLAKEGGEVPLQGDPYEASYAAKMRAARGEPVRHASTSWRDQFEREQTQATTLLSPGELQDFNATLEGVRSILENPPVLARIYFDPNRRKQVLSRNWDPTNPQAEETKAMYAPQEGSWLFRSSRRLPPAAFMEALRYDNFNQRNYIRVHNAFSAPFHPDVTELHILAVSDDTAFLKRLEDAARTDPRVQIKICDNEGEAEAELLHHANRYHVVLTDLLLGKRSGMDLALIVQRDQLPCYVVLASRGEIEPGRGFLLGFDGSIPNEFHPPLEEPTSRSAQQIFNYLSNLVGNGGHAYPQELTDW